MYPDTHASPLMYGLEAGYSSSPVDMLGYMPNAALHDILSAPCDSLFEPYISLQ